jgi:hypothetical protein
MLKINFVLFYFFVFLSSVVNAQQAKTLAATRITEAPVVDGLFYENIWKTLQPKLRRMKARIRQFIITTRF